MNELNNTIETLKKLCLQPGISGYEKETGIMDTLADILRGLTKEVEFDEVGNLVGVIGTGSKTFLIEAHADEVGFVAKVVDKEDTKLEPIGKFVFSKINDSRVFGLNKNSKGEIFHDVVKDQIFFKKDLPGSSVTDGEMVSYERTFSIKNNLVEATALDNRIGCTVLVELLRTLVENPVDDLRCVFVFSQGEETDKTSMAQTIKKYQPNFFVVVDAAYAKPIDFDFSDSETSIPELGNGCALQYKGAGFEVDGELLKKITNLAQEINVKIQKESVSGNLGKTNFSQFSACGFNNGIVVNVPVKDQHSQVSTANLQDLFEAIKLIKAIVRNHIKYSKWQ